MIKNQVPKRIKIGSRNGLNIFSKLKAHKNLNKVSKSQRIKTLEWNKITDENFIERGEICLWCGKHANRAEIDGHHIIRRRKDNNTKENNYPVHRFKCHQEITDKNINVRLYPTKLAWENRNGLRT